MVLCFLKGTSQVVVGLRMTCAYTLNSLPASFSLCASPRAVLFTPRWPPRTQPETLDGIIQEWFYVWVPR